jgi:hypothetical protein
MEMYIRNKSHTISLQLEEEIKARLREGSIRLKRNY